MSQMSKTLQGTSSFTLLARDVITAFRDVIASHKTVTSRSEHTNKGNYYNLVSVSAFLRFSCFVYYMCSSSRSGGIVSQVTIPPRFLYSHYYGLLASVYFYSLPFPYHPPTPFTPPPQPPAVSRRHGESWPCTKPILWMFSHRSKPCPPRLYHPHLPQYTHTHTDIHSHTEITYKRQVRLTPLSSCTLIPLHIPIPSMFWCHAQLPPAHIPFWCRLFKFLVKYDNKPAVDLKQKPYLPQADPWPKIHIRIKTHK